MPYSDFKGKIEKIKPGTQLIRERELSRKMYIIKKGKVRVYKTYMEQRITLAILGEGEIFGELSFFDAEPRSASVEALTHVEVVVIDGKKSLDEIKGLPSWIMPVFKSVFRRFREADQKIAVLESINEFQKNSQKKCDKNASTIYLELLRFVKTFTLIHSKLLKNGEKVSSEVLLQEMDELLGSRCIGLRIFWKTLKEFDFVDNDADENEKKVVLRPEQLDKWNEYLLHEVSQERYMMLKHSSVALLRRIVGFTKAEEFADNYKDGNTVSLNVEDINLKTLPLSSEAMEELKRLRIIELFNDTITINPSMVYRLYLYQSILKAFDHTIVNLD